MLSDPGLPTEEPSPFLASGATRIVNDLAGLTAIYEDPVNLCVHRPRPGQSLCSASARSYAAGALTTDLRRDLWTITPRELEEDRGLAELPEAAGVSDLRGLMRDLARLFAELIGAERLGLRLSVLERPLCPRFHVDRVDLRLVYTILGPGTEWLDHEVVDRRHLGHLAEGRPDECTGLIRPGGRVRRARAEDLCLLKGERWPDNEGRGAVHRSPTPSASTRRLVLTIDSL